MLPSTEDLPPQSETVPLNGLWINHFKQVNKLKFAGRMMLSHFHRGGRLSEMQRYVMAMHHHVPVISPRRGGEQVNKSPTSNESLLGYINVKRVFTAANWSSDTSVVPSRLSGMKKKKAEEEFSGNEIVKFLRGWHFKSRWSWETEPRPRMLFTATLLQSSPPPSTSAHYIWTVTRQGETSPRCVWQTSWVG